MRKSRRKQAPQTELDITSFMNLMIILVPVLLMSMVFSHITVLDLKLPDAAGSAGSDKNMQLELLIREDYIDVNFPQGIRLKRVAKLEQAHDFALVSTVLQELKRQLQDKGVKKRDILILAERETNYQTLVSAMDTVRSFSAVVAASVVQAELFPDIALGDAPPDPGLVADRGQP